MSIQDLVYQWEADAQIPNRNLRTPGWPDEDERRRRLEFIEEELEELFEAERDRDIVEFADALGDLVWVIYGTANAFGIDLDAVIHEIADSNNTKLVGGPKFDKSGKLLKGPDFRKPDIETVLENQEPLI